MNTELRNYDDVSLNVRNSYKKSRMFQNVEFYNKMKNEYDNRNKELINIWDALNLLNHFVDQSDPDMTLPNIHHLFQSAEAARKDDQPEWLQFTCLIHDLGKIMHLFGSHETGTSIREQWAIVGDTFILGCKIPDTIIFPEFNNLNEDHKKYDKYGIYNKNCGLENCKISWGHDEFMYQTLKNNQIDLPEEALYIIRYHSLYLYHDKNEYEHLLNDYDKDMKYWVKLFNKYDLYSKEENKLNIDKLKNYYDVLIKRYFKYENLYF